MQDFTGKVAVVTGGASGVGRALVERFAREGMRVVAADVEKSALEVAVSQVDAGSGEVTGVVTDVPSLRPLAVGTLCLVLLATGLVTYRLRRVMRSRLAGAA